MEMKDGNLDKHHRPESDGTSTVVVMHHRTDLIISRPQTPAKTNTTARPPSLPTTIIAADSMTFNIERMFDEPEYSDVVVFYSGRKTFCHKIILCQSSDYFKKLCGPGSQFAVSLALCYRYHASPERYSEKPLFYIRLSGAGPTSQLRLIVHAGKQTRHHRAPRRRSRCRVSTSPFRVQRRLHR